MLQFSRDSKVEKDLKNINIIINKAIEIASKDYNYEKKYDFRKIKITKNFHETLPEIEIETAHEDNFVNIIISDNGPGVGERET